MTFITVNRISAVLLLALGLAIWLYTESFPSLDGGHPGPGLFPRLIAVLFILSGGLLLIAREKASMEAGETGNWQDWLRWGGLLLLFYFIPFLQDLNISLLVGIGVVVMVTCIMLKARIWVALITTAGTLAIIYWIFGILLGVPL